MFFHHWGITYPSAALQLVNVMVLASLPTSTKVAEKDACSVTAALPPIPAAYGVTPKSVKCEAGELLSGVVDEIGRAHV